MSSEALPISPARFASALLDLPISTLHLKAAELRNSIAHLDYSNEQLKPYAEGNAEGQNGEKDQDCVDAIKENEIVIERMEERIGLLKAEVERRGLRWGEFAEVKAEEETNGEGEVEGSSNPWTDGTFTTGRIVGGEVHMDGQDETANTNGTSNEATMNGEARTNGTGGRLDDEALRRAMEERMREDAEDGGMHL